MMSDREIVLFKPFQVRSKGGAAIHYGNVVELRSVRPVPLLEFAVRECCYYSARDYEQPNYH